MGHGTTNTAWAHYTKVIKHNGWKREAPHKHIQQEPECNLIQAVTYMYAQSNFVAYDVISFS